MLTYFNVVNVLITGLLCFQVCLSVFLLNYWESYERILMKFFRWMDQGPSDLDIGSDKDHSPRPGTFKGYVYIKDC